MRNCVMVARQTLTLFVWVRILVPQPKREHVQRQLYNALFFVVSLGFEPVRHPNPSSATRIFVERSRLLCNWLLLSFVL